MRNSEKYNIQSFINEAKEMEFPALFIHCQKELNFLDNIKFTAKSPLKDLEWEIKNYREFIHQFAYILHSGSRPASMEKSDFLRTKPIFENLVEKNQWKSEGLSIYDI